METVERLQRRVRDYRAGYKQTLTVLEHAKNSTMKNLDGSDRKPVITKTSLMLGLGERDDDIEKTVRDIRNAGVDVITFGQYLRPSHRHMTVQRYVTPKEFDHWKQFAMDLGFKYVASGPLVRSSYRAGELYLKGMLKGDNAASQEH